MKKIYLLSLFCLLGFVAMAQTTVVCLPSGAFSTGSATTAVRSDDIITSSTTPDSKGYAVFDVSSIPAGATIMSATIGYYVSGYCCGVGAPSNCFTYGYVGDLGAIVSAPLLHSAISSGPVLTSSPTTHGVSTGHQVISNAAVVSFIQSNYTVPGGKLSIGWAGGGAKTYTISGYTAPAPVSPYTAVHMPYLQITYCTVPTAVSATAAPNPVCAGRALTLTAAATVTGGGTTAYAWTGPGAYTSAVMSPSFTATLTSSGVYSLSVSHVCTIPGPITATVTATAATASVTVNPAPAVITGSTAALCRTGTLAFTTTTLSNATVPGSWSSSATGVATITGGGLVTSVGTGVTTISYTLPGTGCYATYPMTVNNTPGVTTGPTNVCEGFTVTLSNPVGGGVWSSSSTVATIAAPPVVSGAAAGVAVISYTLAGCPSALHNFTVNGTPPAITGGPNVCMGVAPAPGSPTTFSDAMGGGTWSSADITIATFLPGPPGGPGRLMAVALGTTTITYTSAGGCITTKTVTVDPPVSAITGSPTTICQLLTTTLSNTTVPGFWTTASTTIASVDAGGVVTGLAPGTASITYNVGACRVFEIITVRAAPAPIVGLPPQVCERDSFLLTDPSPAGTWSSLNTALATISSTGFVNAIANTPTASIQYTYSSGCFRQLDFTIRPSPSATVTGDGPTTFCSGGDVTLSVPAGAASYQWYTNSVPMVGQTGDTYYTDSTQTVTVRVINSAGCTTISAPIVVISGISPTVSMGGSDTFCQGGHAVLVADPHGTTGIVTYQWLLNGLNITGANSATLFADKKGNYTAMVSVSGTSGSCVVFTTPLYIHTHNLPSPSITYSSKLLATQNTYQGYQWYLNGIGIGGATRSTLVPAGNGSYRVMVTDTNGCSGYSPAIEIKAVGIEEVTAADVKVFPNPAGSVVHVASPVIVNAVITSIEGKVVLQQTNAKDIDINNLATGVYILTLTDENGVRIKIEKLIKE